MTQGVVLDILRCSLHDGPGIRTTVFLKGCPLACLWCHNPESQATPPVLSFNDTRCTLCQKCQAVCPHGVHQFSANQHLLDRSRCQLCGKCVQSCPAQALEIKGSRQSVFQVMEQVVKDLDYYRQSGGGLTLSGGEPMHQFGFTLALLQAARQQGIHTAMETSGMAQQQQYQRVVPWTDLFLFDYKGTDPVLHRRHTGAENHLILQNLDFLYSSGAKILLRCPLVPGVNDSPAHLAAIAELDRRYPLLEGIDLMPYHSMGNEKARRVGLPVQLDLPNADQDVQTQWRTYLANLGCHKATIS